MSNLWFTVSDLRQFEYCARIPYFTSVLGMNRKRPTTYKMEEGTLEHVHVEDLEQRRSLRSYGLKEGERLFKVNLVSNSLQLTGLLDMLILTDKEAIPVEFKNSLESRVNPNHVMQLAAYALIIEEQYGRSVERAFVHFIPTKQSKEVALKPITKDKLHQRLSALQQMVDHEALPDATPFRGRCVDCEFHNFCPDVW